MKSELSVRKAVMMNLKVDIERPDLCHNTSAESAPVFQGRLWDACGRHGDS